jgi:sortase A
MLVTFLLARGWGEFQSWSDIRAFEQAVAYQAPSPAQPDGDVTEYSPEPDYTLWSSKRIADYHEGNIQRDDPPLAILSIESLDLKVPVYNGTDEINLNRGAGRIIGTAGIDSPGNLGIAGHRDGFFRVLKDIAVGDSIDMLTYQGNKEFVVSSISIVDPTDVSVLAPTDDSTITLVTCYPFYYVGHAPKRYIVKGELLSNQVSQS